MERVAVVTGGSSGIGLCTAQELARRGAAVYELSRREAGHARVRHLTADVTDFDAVSAAAKAVYDAQGRIDLLVCNAGLGISGAVEFTDAAEARRLFDVNFFGAVNAVRAAVPYMRRTGGRIVIISSMAAPLPIPFQAFYSASKAALSALALALRNELRPFGISVCAVLPGDIASGFTAARAKNHMGDDVYGGRIARSVAVMERDERGGMAPERAARAIARTALRRRVRPLYSVGLKYKAFSVLVRLLPAGIVNWIVGLLYAK